MKILHVADTHLGYSAYRKTTEEGINQRELDAYNAFQEFIDYAVKTKPDLIIHAGDLFDSVRPNNRALTFAIRQILRVSKKSIPFIIIAGNHEQPKLKETGHIFSIFDHIENVYPVYNEKYEILEFEIDKKKIAIHTIPQYTSKKDFNEDLKKLKPTKSADYNIFVAHGSVTGLKEFKMNEFNELIIPTNALHNNFDYIALGHFHSFTKINEKTYYSGSTERYTFIDATDKKGFIKVEFKNKDLKTRFIELKNRPMIDTKPIKCSNLKLDEVMKTIRQTVKDIGPREKTIRMTLEDIPAHIYRGIDFAEIRKISNEAVHFEIKADVVKDDSEKISTNSKIDALAQEFKLFLENQNVKEKNILLKLGIGYIEKVEAKEEGR